MKTRLELVTMACDLHVHAFQAGIRNDDRLFDTAESDRTHLCAAIDEVFEDLQEKKERIRDVEHEYRMTLDAFDADIAKYKREIENLRDELKLTRLRLENLKKYGEEVPDIRNMYPPFPEVAREYVDAVEDIAEGRRGGK